MQRIVILDRDGVINQDSADYIKSTSEWIPIPGSLEAIALLCQNEFDVFIATNQSGIARGKLDVETLTEIHKHMCAAVEDLGGKITGIAYCPHHPDENCSCRKPKTGMLEQLARDYELTIVGQPFVGDSLKDIRTAEAAGCEAVLVLTGSGEETLHLRPHHQPIYKDLLEFAEYMATT